MVRGGQMGKKLIISSASIEKQMRGVYISSCQFQQAVYLWNRNDADRNTAVQS